jgi:simple sugar transport system substrate-binding protein
MFRKKLFLILCSLAVFSLLLTACTPAPAEPDAEEPSAEEVTAEDVEEAEESEAEEPEAEEAEESAEPLTIALLVGGPAEDGGYASVFNKAVLYVDEYFGDAVDTVVVEFVPYSEEATRTIEQLIADGADMIVDGATLLDFLDAASEAHPEVAFLRVDYAFLDNEAIMYVERGRPFYLVGLAGALMSDTGQLGWVDSFPSIYGDAWLNSLIMGARSVNPEATVTAAYIGSWFDPTASRQASEALIDSGVDFLTGIVNMPTNITVAEERGVRASGVDTPMGEFGPQAYVLTLAHSFDENLKNEVQNLLDGTWEGNGEFRIVEIGPNLVIDWGSNVPQDVIDTVETVYEDMVGGWTPFTGPIYDIEGNLVIAEGEELTEFDIFLGLDYIVDGVIRSE